MLKAVEVVCGVTGEVEVVVGAVIGTYEVVAAWLVACRLWSSDWMATFGSVYVDLCACGSFWRPYSATPINATDTRNTIRSDGTRSTGGV